MISLPVFWLFLGTLAIFWYFQKKRNCKSNRNGLKDLPGPKGIPLLGNALQLGNQFHKQVDQWADEFGEIYQIKMGPQVMVIISDPKLVKELFSCSNYVGKPYFPEMNVYEEDRLGIIQSEGELWEVHRRFLLRQLRDFGFGKSAMETLIIDEVEEVINNFKEMEGKAISDIKKTLNLAVINSLWIIVSQKRFQHDDPQLLTLVDNIQKVLCDLLSSGIFAFLPTSLKKLIPNLSGYNKSRNLIKNSRKWFEDQVEQHKATYKDGEIRDFIDVFISEMRTATETNSMFYGEKAEKQLVATLYDLFAGGTDTTSTTLKWAVLFLTKFPKIQKKFQDEIKTVTNNSQNTSVADKEIMPYSMALIDEILRYSSITPSGAFHKSCSEKEFHGYYIPKDAWVMPNLYHIHFSKKLWKDPESFQPERHLSPDGKTYLKSENLLPFQAGKRQCIGEGFARNTIFLFLTNLFQRFTFTFDSDQPEPSLEPRSNFMLYPNNYSVIVKDNLF